MSRLPHNPEHEKPLSAVNVNVKFDDIFNFISRNDLDQKITETSLFNDSDNRNPFNDDLIRCYAIKPQEHCFGIRVNTTLSYCAINQKVSFVNCIFHLFFFFSYKCIFFRKLFFSFFRNCRFSIYGTNYFR